MESVGGFPQRVRLSCGSVGWREDEINAWIGTRERGVGVVPAVHHRQRAA